MTPTSTQLERAVGELRSEKSVGVPRQPSTPSRILLAAVRGYQLLRVGRPTGCRYVPSCSEYATEAIGRFGSWHGGLLAARRVLRCGPWGGHGVDPVPERTPR